MYIVIWFCDMKFSTLFKLALAILWNLKAVIVFGLVIASDFHAVFPCNFIKMQMLSTLIVFKGGKLFEDIAPRYVPLPFWQWGP